MADNSLDVNLTYARELYHAQEKRTSDIVTRTGVFIGFDGALIGLSAKFTVTQHYEKVALVTALVVLVAAAIIGLITAWPRGFLATPTVKALHGSLGWPSEQTTAKLLESTLTATSENAVKLARQENWYVRMMLVLGAGIALVAIVAVMVAT